MTSPIQYVRLAMYGPIYAVYWTRNKSGDMYLAGFLDEANRAAYLAQHPAWEVVE